MNKRRQTLEPRNINTTRKKPKMRKRQESSSSDEVPASMISSCSEEEEIPETPPKDSPCSSIISASPNQSPSAVDLIEEESTPSTCPSPIAGHSKTNQLQKSLIQDIESADTDDEDNDGFNITTFIETDSEPPSQELQSQHRRLRQQQLPAALTQRPPGYSMVQPKDTVDIPLTIPNPKKHPITVLSSRPIPVKNGLADELKQALFDYRSKENFWLYDIKLGLLADPAALEWVQVKSIKKFLSYCLAVDVQRGQGDTTQRLLLNINWDNSFRSLQVGDTLMVNFRAAAPKQWKHQQLHFFPYVRRCSPTEVPKE